jgi:hypothetical protein
MEVFDEIKAVLNGRAIPQSGAPIESIAMEDSLFGAKPFHTHLELARKAHAAQNIASSLYYYESAKTEFLQMVKGAENTSAFRTYQAQLCAIGLELHQDVTRIYFLDLTDA